MKNGICPKCGSNEVLGTLPLWISRNPNRGNVRLCACPKGSKASSWLWYVVNVAIPSSTPRITKPLMNGTERDMGVHDRSTASLFGEVFVL